MTRLWVMVAVLLLVLAGVRPTARAQEAAAEPVTLERVQHLERRVVELLGELGEARAERDRLRAVLQRFLDQYDQFEADRLLLVEFRKDLPGERGEAEAYLGRLRSLALVADPSRLAPLATRVMQSAPIYLDWRHAAYPNADARAQAFAETGAHGFPTALANLRNAVLLSVSNRMDAFLNLLDRAF